MVNLIIFDYTSTYIYIYISFYVVNSIIFFQTSIIILFVYFVSYLEKLSNTLQAKGGTKKKKKNTKAFLEQLLNSDAVMKLQKNKKIISSIGWK